MNVDILHVEWTFGKEKEIHDIDLSKNYNKIETPGRMLPYGPSVCVALQIWSTFVRTLYKVKYCSQEIQVSDIDKYNKDVCQEFKSALVSSTSWLPKQTGISLLLQCGMRKIFIANGELKESFSDPTLDIILNEVVIIPRNVDIIGFINVNPYRYLYDLDSVLCGYGSMLCHALSNMRIREDNHKVCIGKGLVYNLCVPSSRRVIIDTIYGRIPLDQSSLYLRTLIPLMLILQEKLITNSTIVFNVDTKVFGDNWYWLHDTLTEYTATNKCKLIIIDNVM